MAVKMTYLAGFKDGTESQDARTEQAVLQDMGEALKIKLNEWITEGEISVNAGIDLLAFTEALKSGKPPEGMKL